jgi:uncharacterized protein YwgA
MLENELWWFRIGVLASLIKKAPHPPGRTGMMKFAYLLQAVRGVPLGYRFDLYNYGPYDSSVLNDLSQAKSMGAIDSKMVQYTQNLGYEYEPAGGYMDLLKKSKEKLEPYRDAIEWVLDLFGEENAGRLELISTIVFAHREALRKHDAISDKELAKRVNQIKPHFSEEIILETIQELRIKDASILPKPDALSA